MTIIHVQEYSYCKLYLEIKIFFQELNEKNEEQWDLTRNTGICLQEHSTEYNVHMLYNKDKMHRYKCWFC